MKDAIYHQRNVPIHIKHGVHSSLSVALFNSGSVIVTTSADYGALSVSMHTDAESLRAIAKLLNEAVEALTVKVEEAA